MPNDHNRRRRYTGKRPRIDLCSHTIHRLRKYGYGKQDLTEALFGEPVRAEAGMRPRYRRPIIIGWQWPDVRRTGHVDRKHIIVGVNRQGRVMMTVNAINAATEVPQVVTIWDPTTPDNEQFWAPDLLRPTQAGIDRLPVTYWYLPS